MKLMIKVISKGLLNIKIFLGLNCLHIAAQGDQPIALVINIFISINNKKLSRRFISK